MTNSWRTSRGPV